MCHDRRPIPCEPDEKVGGIGVARQGPDLISDARRGKAVRGIF